MHLCEKTASSNACQCAWDYSPVGWSSISRSFWPDIIGFTIEPKTTEFGNKRYREAVEKYGQDELDAITRTLSLEGHLPLLNCNTSIKSAATANTPEQPQDKASTSSVCAGQTTPICTGKIIGKWMSNDGTADLMLTFSTDGLAKMESDKHPTTTAPWQAVDAQTVVIDVSKDDGPVEQMKVEMVSEVVSLSAITETGAVALGKMIFLPAEGNPAKGRQTLPPGVWTIGGMINRGEEISPLSPDHVDLACANSLIVSEADGTSQYYQHDYDKAGAGKPMAFTRQGECAQKPGGKESCVFRLPDKVETSEGAPEYFKDGATFLYRDKVHVDWPIQRLHRCPFSNDAVKTVVSTSAAGSWSKAMMRWADIYEALNNQESVASASADVLAQHMLRFYASVKK